MKLSTDFKVPLCRSVARWNIQQNMHNRGKERNARKSLCSGLLMSYELENTAPSKTSLCSPSNKWEGIWLRRWTKAFPEHELEQQLLNRVTIKSLPMAVVVLSQKSLFCPCFVCTPTKWSPERYHAQGELSSPETSLPRTRFFNTWFTLDVVQHQFLIANTSVLLLQNNTVTCQTTEISAITTTSILHKSFFHSMSIVYLELSQCSMLQMQVLCSRTLTAKILILFQLMSI